MIETLKIEIGITEKRYWVEIEGVKLYWDNQYTFLTKVRNMIKRFLENTESLRVLRLLAGMKDSEAK